MVSRYGGFCEQGWAVVKKTASKSLRFAEGSVKWFDSKKGYGFLAAEDGRDVFVHYTSICRNGFKSLRSGQRVRYEQLESEKGLLAKTFRSLR